MHLSRMIAVSAAVLALSAACAQPQGSVGGGDWGAEVDPAVLERWTDFPVDASPRPIVLIGSPLLEAGYHTDDAKLAVISGRIELAASLPDGPATVTAMLDGVAHDLPAISAEAAFEQVRSVGKPENAPGEKPTPLTITKVELGTAAFLTDRGKAELPAWLFHAPDSFEPLAWPALDRNAFFRFGEIDYPLAIDGNEVSPDGRTVTVTMPAPHPDACPGDPYLRHVPVVFESDTAVLVGVRKEVASHAPGPPLENCGYDAMLRTARYTVTLDRPLGNRVLIDSSGAPVPIATG